MQWNQKVENDLEKVNSKKIVYHSHDWMLKLVIAPPPDTRFDVELDTGDREGLCCRVFGGIIQQFSSILWLESSRDWPRLNVLFLFFFIAAIVNQKENLGDFRFRWCGARALRFTRVEIWIWIFLLCHGPMTRPLFPQMRLPPRPPEGKNFKKGKRKSFWLSLIHKSTSR